MIGKTLAHYRVLEKIGSGGMGEVYLAEDIELDRKIALKILPPELAASDEQRARFKREAKAIAALNHPNIVHVYSVEEADGVHFITMELVKGNTLRELISKKGMGLEAMLDVAVPLADAVAAAHEHGVVHRDLKPENVMITDEGRVKILDFGLALLHERTPALEGSQLPTITKEGGFAGTVSYMSPEQAEGKPVDHRTDIFSLGIVLHEMATGTKPFSGDSAASVISSILKDTPASVTDVEPALPSDLAKAVRRCLAKDPTRRYQSALDIRNELEELRDADDTPQDAAVRRSGVSYPVVAGVALLAVIATYLFIGRDADVGTDPGTISGSLAQLTSDPGEEYYPSISPDGNSFVYTSYASGNWDIYLRRVEGERAINLTENSPDDDVQPVYSPDGQQIAFRSERDGGGLFVMGATGESVRRVASKGANPAWSPDGEEIVFATERIIQPNNRTSVSQLWIADVATGEERLLFNGDAVQPHWSPGGERIAYWAVGDGAIRDVWTVSRNGEEAVPVTDDAPVDWNPIWSPDGRHLYFSSDRGGNMNVWRVAIDESTGKTTGEPEAVTTGAVAWAWQLSLSRDGRRMLYAAAVESSNIVKAKFDVPNAAIEDPLVPITEGSTVFVIPNVSHDGQFLAFQTAVTPQDIYVSRIDGSDVRQLTNDVAKDRAARWSPDDSRIAFFSDRGGTNEIWTIRPDGSGLRQMTHVNGTPSVMYPTWSPDGNKLAYYVNQVGTFIIDTNRAWEEQTPTKLPPLDENTTFSSWDWSSDGSTIAGFEVHPDGRYDGVVLYSLASGTYERMTHFGALPIWLSDGRRLLFGDTREYHLLNTETRDHVRIFQVAPPYRTTVPALSRDDRAIYFGLRKTETDIWMLTLDERGER